MREKKIKVLLIEDNPDDAELIRRKLDRSVNIKFSVSTVMRLQDGLEHLDHNKPDLIVSDLGLPDSHGLDTVTKILLSSPHIPLVMLSGFDDEAIAIKAVKAGAQDYLVKGQLENTQIERSFSYAIERARLELELEQNAREIYTIHANLLKILDKNADAIIVVSEDKKILFANPAAELILGRKPKELLNKPFDFPVDICKASEIEINQPGKGKIIAEMNAVEINWEGKNACLASIHNITKRKKAEAALRESEEKFSRAFRCSPDVIVISSMKDGTIIEANDTFLRLTGYTHAEVINKKASELGIWAIPEERAGMVAALKENGMVSNQEFHFRMKSGEIRTWLFSAEIITLSNKPCILSVTSDITERKKAEEVLRFSDTALKSIHEGVFATDNEFRITRWNSICEQMFGIKASEAIGKFIGDTVTMVEEYPGQNEKRVNLLISRGFNREEQIYRTPRGDIWVDVHAQAIEGNGKRYGWVTLVSDISERKRTEEALKRAAEEWRTTFDSITDMVSVQDKDFRIIRGNKAYAHACGVKSQELPGKKCYEVVHHSESPPENCPHQETVRTKKTVTREVFEPQLGIYLEVTTSPIINEAGELNGTVHIMKDITERQRVEEMLRFSDAAFKSIHESVIATDLKYVITHWNLISEQIYGIKASEAIGKKLLDVIEIVETHPGENDRRFKTLEANGYYQEEQLHRTRQGEIWVDVRMQAIEKNGERYGWVALGTAITQRKLAEEALKRSEEKYRELISTSTDGIVSADPQMRVLIWNHGAERIFGYTEKEMLGQNIFKIIPIKDRKETRKGLTQLNKTNLSKATHKVYEIGGLRKNGTEVPVELSVSLRKSGENNITTAIIRDVTERKIAEEKLRKIDEMKSEFLSNVSHELRTPLQSISGFTKLIMSGHVPDPATQQEFLQIIDRETTHLGNLINSLLDMSRLEAGRFQIYRKLIPIRETIIESVRMFHSLAREKSIALSEDIPPQIPEIEVDNERMRQVIINLLSNAIKFSDPGSSVNVKVEKREGDLLFQVSDRGTGIREEAMQHIFERFYRAEGEMVRGGTGLGLYISKQIIEAHGGRIWAESKFGEGSTFSFTLPLNGKGGNGDGKENPGH